MTHFNPTAGMSGLAATAYWAWMAFLASWWAGALWVSQAVKKAPAGRRTAYFVGFAIGFCLLFAFVGGPRIAVPAALQALLLAAEIAAFGFAWWARLHLGRLWSSGLTIREDHRAVDTGPYVLARHPIYTGFIAASWAFALASGSVIRLAGAAVLTVVMAAKAAEEERWLIQELGAAGYESYRARTRMLVPLPRRDLRR